MCSSDLPTVLANEIHEIALAQHLSGETIVGTGANPGQQLCTPLANGADEHAAGGQLIEQRLGDFGAASGDHDAIEGCQVGATAGTVPQVDHDVGDAETVERGAGAGREPGDALD